MIDGERKRQHSKIVVCLGNRQSKQLTDLRIKVCYKCTVMHKVDPGAGWNENIENSHERGLGEHERCTN